MGRDDGSDRLGEVDLDAQIVGGGEGKTDTALLDRWSLKEKNPTFTTIYKTYKVKLLLQQGDTEL